MPGPVPKRADQRRRRNKPEGPSLTTLAAGEAPEVPPHDEGWHQIAIDWYSSLALSGQSQFYEASDWATARYLAEAMSRNLESPKMSAQMFQSVLSGMTDLLTTEGARRRARVELERGGPVVDPAELARVAMMDRYRKAATDAG